MCSALLGLCLPEFADVRVAELLAAGLGSCKGFFSALCNPVPFFLGDRCVDVQHEWIHIWTQFGDDEGHALHHQTADEMHVAAQSIELGDHNRCCTRPGALADLACRL